MYVYYYGFCCSCGKPVAGICYALSARMIADYPTTKGDIDAMGKIMFITAFKGGVGKTTVTANIASCLALTGKKVLVVDGDFGMRCMDIVLGLENDVLFDCSDLLRGDCDFDSAVTTLFDGLDFLPAPMRFCDETIPLENYRKVFADAKEKYDFVLIDSGADMTEHYKGFLSVADDAAVISMHQSSSVRAAEKAARILAGANLLSTKLIINGYRAGDAENGKLPDAFDIIKASSLQLLGIVPFDEKLPPDQELGILSLTGNKNAKAHPYEAAFANIACRMRGIKVPLFKTVYRTAKRKAYILGNY